MSPRRAYTAHQTRAKQRGIAFELTFEQWWKIWEPRYAVRGRRADEIGMCRTLDAGPYSPENVRLDTPKGNAAERGLVHRINKAPAAFLTQKQTRGGSTAVAADWCMRNPFAPYIEEDEEY